MPQTHKSGFQWFLSASRLAHLTRRSSPYLAGFTSRLHRRRRASSIPLGEEDLPQKDAFLFLLRVRFSSRSGRKFAVSNLNLITEMASRTTSEIRLKFSSFLLAWQNPVQIPTRDGPDLLPRKVYGRDLRRVSC